MKVLLEVKTVPIGAVVTKKNEEKKYTVRDRVKILGENTPHKELCADDGTRFLISDNGDINVISGDTEVIWNVANGILYRMLYEIVEQQPFPEY